MKRAAQYLNPGEPAWEDVPDYTQPSRGADILSVLLPPGSAPVAYADVEPSKALITQIAVTSEDEATVVRAVRDEAHRRIADLEAQRKTVTAPLAAAKAAVDALFRPVREPLEELKSLCKGVLDGWETRKLAAEAEARAQAKALSAGGDSQAAETIMETRPQAKGQRVWEVDSANVDLAAVPREFLTVDWSAVKIHCRTYKDSETIPAVPGIPFVRKVLTRVGG